MNMKNIVHPKQKGEATEAIITAEFMKRGFLCSKPIGDNQPFDLIVYNKARNTLIKIQCRLANVKNGVFRAKLMSTRSSRTKNYITDNREFIDYYAFYAEESGKVYIIKSETDSTKSIYLRLVEAKKPLKNMKYADNYELDKHIALFTE